MELEELQFQTEFIDNESVADKYPSFHGLTNVARSYSDARNGAFEDQDIEVYKNQNEEIRNYVQFPDMSKEDTFDQPKKTILFFKENVSHNLNNEDSLFYTVLYTICCEKTEKFEPCMQTMRN